MARDDDMPVTIDVDVTAREAPTVIAGGILDALEGALAVVVVVVVDGRPAEVRVGIAAQAPTAAASVPELLREAAANLEANGARRVVVRDATDAEQRAALLDAMRRRRGN